MLKPKHLLLTPLLVLGPVGCAHDAPAETTIVVPTDAVAGRGYAPDGSIPSRRYVVRMSDGKRDWEVEFPEVATGYELAIPLEEDPATAGAPVVEAPGLTDADTELLAALRRENPEMERQGVYVDGRRWPEAPPADGSGAGPAGDAGQAAAPVASRDPGGRSAPGATSGRAEDAPAPSRPSYLLGVDEVQRLYRAGQHEVALVKLVDLVESYPGDPRLLAMKGSLWLKLGRPDLAAEAWEAALRIDPSDRSLVRALKRLRDLERRDDASESTP